MIFTSEVFAVNISIILVYLQREGERERMIVSILAGQHLKCTMDKRQRGAILTPGLGC